ncbi:minor capsid protein [Weissella bombi]|uniref:Minor capsid protein n=1 Tax=Weissella bombi TaxID=1505725 RepID=A0A1C4C7V1_9LACO|nr:minor capsid protein [Weissella bombi]SCC15142.1 Minor capsid protein [Weissella bombi]
MADQQIHLDVGHIDKMLSPANKQKAKLALANQVAIDMNKYVPLKKGDLRANRTVTADRISFGEVYARAQYYGTNDNGKTTFQNYTTTGTGPKWDLKAKDKNIDKWTDTFKKGVTKYQ